MTVELKVTRVKGGHTGDIRSWTLRLRRWGWRFHREHYPPMRKRS